jgi:hypothetical protein
MRRNVAGDIYDVMLADMLAGRYRSMEWYRVALESLHALAKEEEAEDIAFRGDAAA